MPIYDDLATTDPAIHGTVMGEIRREQEGVELIPSENYVSGAVLEALGSPFTNKYAEGYPGKRYYGGQEFTDQMETICIERATTLFGCDHANVQPSSGAGANVAVYMGWMEPGDTILGMDLSHGGHLTHGAPVTHMAKLYNFVRYKMKDIETGEIDYDEMLEIAKKERPKIILAGYTSYPRDIDYDKFAAIAKEVDAIAMADTAHVTGLIAAGVLKNPFDAGFQVMTTTTHKTLRGPRGAMILSNGTVGNPLKKCEKTVENLPTIIDRSVFPGLQGGPHMHQTAAIAVALHEAMQPEFKEYGAQILKNAKQMASSLMNHGCKLVTNGTDNHLMVVDCVQSFDMGGKETEYLFDRIGITGNKSPIPDDPNPPFRPSGLRIGTPAITTRGMKEAEMDQLVTFMMKAIEVKDDDNAIASLHEEVKEFCLQYPVPGMS